jgi:hypothetical protein
MGNNVESVSLVFSLVEIFVCWQLPEPLFLPGLLKEDQTNGKASTKASSISERLFYDFDSSTPLVRLSPSAAVKFEPTV